MGEVCEVLEFLLSFSEICEDYVAGSHDHFIQGFAEAYLRTSPSCHDPCLVEEKEQDMLPYSGEWDPVLTEFIQERNDKELICEFENGAFNRTWIQGTKVTEYSTSEFIDGPIPMTKYTTVYYPADGVSKPIVNERFQIEEREIVVDGVAQKSKLEERRELMESILQEIQNYNSTNVQENDVTVENLDTISENLAVEEDAFYENHLQAYWEKLNAQNEVYGQETKGENGRVERDEYEIMDEDKEMESVYGYNAQTRESAMYQSMYQMGNSEEYETDSIYYIINENLAVEENALYENNLQAYWEKLNAQNGVCGPKDCNQNIAHLLAFASQSETKLEVAAPEDFDFSFENGDGHCVPSPTADANDLELDVLNAYLNVLEEQRMVETSSHPSFPSKRAMIDVGVQTDSNFLTLHLSPPMGGINPSTLDQTSMKNAYDSTVLGSDSPMSAEFDTDCDTMSEEMDGTQENEPSLSVEISSEFWNPLFSPIAESMSTRSVILSPTEEENSAKKSEGRKFWSRVKKNLKKMFCCFGHFGKDN